MKVEIVDVNNILVFIQNNIRIRKHPVQKGIYYLTVMNTEDTIILTESDLSSLYDIIHEIFNRKGSRFEG